MRRECWLINRLIIYREYVGVDNTGQITEKLIYLTQRFGQWTGLLRGVTSRYKIYTYCNTVYLLDVRNRRQRQSQPVAFSIKLYLPR